MTPPIVLGFGMTWSTIRSSPANYVSERSFPAAIRAALPSTTRRNAHFGLWARRIAWTRLRPRSSARYANRNTIAVFERVATIAGRRAFSEDGPKGTSLQERILEY